MGRMRLLALSLGICLVQGLGNPVLSETPVQSQEKPTQSKATPAAPVAASPKTAEKPAVEKPLTQKPAIVSTEKKAPASLGVEKALEKKPAAASPVEKKPATSPPAAVEKKPAAIPPAAAEKKTTTSAVKAEKTPEKPATKSPATGKATSVQAEKPKTDKKVLQGQVSQKPGQKNQLADEVLPPEKRVIDLLHKVPLEIDGYAEVKGLPDKLTQADEIIEVINQSPNLLVHMELLRRGYHQLPKDEQDKLVNTLQNRYQANNNDVIKFFDHGYAQLVFKDNKTGLFFLRKANDRIKNQFSSLAYAMAQADVDMNFENGPVNSMTFRKLDVTYKLSDAVEFDSKNHQPGFWPSFIRVTKHLEPLGPFANFINTDFSSTYVPFGSNSGEKVEISRVESTAVSPDGKEPKEAGKCDVAYGAGSAGINWQRHFRSVPIKLGNGQSGNSHFFHTETPNQYKVLVTNSSNQVLAELISPIAPYIVEDINGDGVDELVIRQFLLKPEEPVKVYRFSHGCGYQLDKTVSAYFK